MHSFEENHEITALTMNDESKSGVRTKSSHAGYIGECTRTRMQGVLGTVSVRGLLWRVRLLGMISRRLDEDGSAKEGKRYPICLGHCNVQVSFDPL
jgi:hypothetical protein